jgi:hypothetical protein
MATSAFKLIPEAEQGDYFGVIADLSLIKPTIGFRDFINDDVINIQVIPHGSSDAVAFSSVKINNASEETHVKITDGDGFDGIQAGKYYISYEIMRDTQQVGGGDSIPLTYPSHPPHKSPTVTLAQPSANTRTKDEQLWHDIVHSRPDFNHYQAFIDGVLSFSDSSGITSLNETARNFAKNRLPFTNVDEYALVKFATEYYMKKTLNIETSYYNANMPLPLYQHVTETYDEVENDYKPRTFGAENTRNRNRDTIIKNDNSLKKERTQSVPMIELLWSYWMEQAMVIQTMGAVSLRFQNIKGAHAVEPLMRFDTGPLRPLSTLIWGFCQDEQHRTTLARRVSEYQHAYNLTLIGRAVPKMQGVDNRSYFLEAFHNLLYQASMYFKDFDDMTRRADAFPLLNSLREVHLLLSEGYHNAYMNMTWTTRMEMRMMQYILARPEMKMFLGGRPRVPYPEQWMDKVDTMKQIQGWDNSSTLHYFDLANAGESILLGIRFGDWTTSSFTAESASNFIIALRPQIQTYISALFSVTGLNLSADSAQPVTAEQRAMQPAVLIQRRMQAAQRPQSQAQFQSSQQAQLQSPMQAQAPMQVMTRTKVLRRF